MIHFESILKKWAQFSKYLENLDHVESSSKRHMHAAVGNIRRMLGVRLAVASGIAGMVVSRRT